MRRPLALAALVLIVLAWNAALVAAPRDLTPRLAAVTYAAGSLICHQRPERSFQHEGAQYPVCARCLGLYVGALAGVLAWCAVGGFGVVVSTTGRRWLNADTARRSLVVVALPTVTSVALAWAGVWETDNVARALLALPLGAIIAAIITAVAAGDLR